MNKHFFTYMEEFETEVANSRLGIDKVVSINNQTNPSILNIAYSMGWTFDSDTITAIDYYGYIKKSSSLIDLGYKINSKSLIARVINFQSIKIEEIISINHKLITFFPEYKNVILDLRGFNN